MISFVTSIDSAVLQTLYSARNPFLVQMFIWVSKLATVQTVLGLAVLAVIALAYRKRWALVGGLMTSVGGSGVATWVIKEIVARSRPVTEAVYLETTSSFPSSHANLVIAFYGFLLWMFWSNLSQLQRKVAAVIFGIIALAVGFSRLYLGVHYLSDVLAGYILGYIFVYVGIFVVRKLEQRQLNISQHL